MARYTAFIALALLGMLALATAEVRSLQQLSLDASLDCFFV